MKLAGGKIDWESVARQQRKGFVSLAVFQPCTEVGPDQELGTSQVPPWLSAALQVLDGVSLGRPFSTVAV